MFEAFTAAQYRALDHDAFVARKNEVTDLLSADTLPEGVTDEMLFAEVELIQADLERRNKAVEMRNANISKVNEGAGTVLAANEPAKPAAQERKAEHSFVVRDGNFTDTREYREAFVRHFTKQAPMPADMIAKAQAEVRAATPVAMNEAYTNMTDTFTNTYSSLVPVPLTLSQEVAREIHNYGGLDTKVNHTSYPGGYVVFESDMQAEFMWIGDKEVSPFHDDYDPEAFQFGAKQLEYRHSRTMLAEAMMSDQFKSLLAPAIAEGYSKALNAAILKGNGTTQPRGILTDERLTGTNGKATVLEVTKEDVASWEFWVRALFAPGFNGAYRNGGEWVMGDGTWGTKIATLRDDNNRPIANYSSTGDALNEAIQPRIQSRPVNLIDAVVLPGFDECEVGDVFAIYGNLRNYTLNTQPGMPLSTTSWDDHDTNTKKTKVLMACDGRVTNPFGWLLLKKKASA